MEEVRQTLSKQELRARRRRGTEKLRNILLALIAIFIVSLVGLAVGGSTWFAGIFLSVLLGLPTLLMFVVVRAGLFLRDIRTGGIEIVTGPTLEWAAIASSPNEEAAATILRAARFYVVAISDVAIAISPNLATRQRAKDWVVGFNSGSADAPVAHVIPFIDIERMVLPSHSRPEIITADTRFLFHGVNPARWSSFQHRLFGLAGRIGFLETIGARANTFSRMVEASLDAQEVPSGGPEVGVVGSARYRRCWVFAALALVLAASLLATALSLSLAAGAAALVFVTLAARVRLEVSHDGIVVGNVFRTHRVQWHEIEHLRMARRPDYWRRPGGGFIHAPVLEIETNKRTIGVTATMWPTKHDLASALRMVRSQRPSTDLVVPTLAEFDFGPEHDLPVVNLGGGPSMFDLDGLRSDASEQGPGGRTSEILHELYGR